MMRHSGAGSARDVSRNPLISLRAVCLREVREVTCNPLISLRGVCGREVPYYYVIGMGLHEERPIPLLSNSWFETDRRHAMRYRGLQSCLLRGPEPVRGCAPINRNNSGSTEPEKIAYPVIGMPSAAFDQPLALHASRCRAPHCFALRHLRKSGASVPTPKLAQAERLGHWSVTAMSNHNTRFRGIVRARAEENPVALVAQIQSAFAAFKGRNEAELAAARAEIKELGNFLDETNAQLAQMKLGGGAAASGATPAQAREANTAMRTMLGTGDMQALRGLTANAAMSTDNDPSGGYTVLPVLSDNMTKKLFNQSPIRRLARIENIPTGGSWEEIIDNGDVGASWVGEHDSRTATQAPTIGKVSINLDESYALVPVTQRLIDDSNIDIVKFVSDKASDKFLRQEGTAFISGDGVGKPKGVLAYGTSIATDATRAWGTIQYLKTGVAAALSDDTNNGSDAIKSVMWSLRAPYRQGASWLMNSNTASVVDKFKDGNGVYLWRDSLAAGVPPTLAGYPVEICEDMPDIAADAFPIAFANLKTAYVIVDRPGVRFLRDPYTDKPNVLLYVYRRVGGGMVNSEAIKLLKVAA